MIIFVDIDETICTGGKSGNYAIAIPLYDKIEIINQKYDEGHTIIYWTARGATTGIDWKDITEKQLEQWGCKYHQLRLDKPYYDFLVEDKSCLIADLDYLVDTKARYTERN